MTKLIFLHIVVALHCTQHIKMALLVKGEACIPIETSAFSEVIVGHETYPIPNATILGSSNNLILLGALNGML